MVNKLCIRSDGSYAYITIDGQKHMESVYGIFVSNNLKDQENLQNIQSLTQAMVQNGVALSTVAETMRATSFSSLLDKVKESEKQAQETARQEQQAQQKALEEQRHIEEEKLALEYKKLDTPLDPYKEEELQIKKLEIDLKYKELEEKIRNNKEKEDIERDKINKKE